MLSPLRNRFGIPGVISVIALVFAMLGGAYAASNSGDTKADGKATASAKAKRGPRGPKGPAGPAGAQGPAGPQGPAGAAGAKGDKGDKGDAGNTGSAGASVTGTPIAAGGACGVGVTGVKYTLNSTATNICNGKNGEKGEAGEDGETGFTSTLPPGETETGTWAAGPPPSLSSEIPIGVFMNPFIPLTFNIPLEETPEALHFVNTEGEEATAGAPGFGPVENCLGSAEGPTAPPGHLCVYGAFEQLEEGGGFSPEAPSMVFSSGAIFQYQLIKGSFALGTWAVTAPEP